MSPVHEQLFVNKTKRRSTFALTKRDLEIKPMNRKSNQEAKVKHTNNISAIRCQSQKWGQSSFEEVE